jgi:hypothetical protein
LRDYHRPEEEEPEADRPAEEPAADGLAEPEAEEEIIEPEPEIVDDESKSEESTKLGEQITEEESEPEVPNEDLIAAAREVVNLQIQILQAQAQILQDEADRLLAAAAGRAAEQQATEARLQAQQAPDRLAQEAAVRLAAQR